MDEHREEREELAALARAERDDAREAVVAVTMNELIDALGRAPSGTDVFVRFQGIAFSIESVRVVYVGGSENGWAVEIDPDTFTTTGAR